jgi:hypothetical protein
MFHEHFAYVLLDSIDQPLEIHGFDQEETIVFEQTIPG